MRSAQRVLWLWLVALAFASSGQLGHGGAGRAHLRAPGPRLQERASAGSARTDNEGERLDEEGERGKGGTRKRVGCAGSIVGVGDEGVGKRGRWESDPPSSKGEDSQARQRTQGQTHIESCSDSETESGTVDIATDTETDAARDDERDQVEEESEESASEDSTSSQASLNEASPGQQQCPAGHLCRTGKHCAFRLLQDIALQSEPWAVSVGPSDGLLYVALPLIHKILVMHPQTGAVMRAFHSRGIPSYEPGERAGHAALGESPAAEEFDLRKQDSRTGKADKGSLFCASIFCACLALCLSHMRAHTQRETDAHKHQARAQGLRHTAWVCTQTRNNTHTLQAAIQAEHAQRHQLHQQRQPSCGRQREFSRPSHVPRWHPAGYSS